MHHRPTHPPVADRLPARARTPRAPRARMSGARRRIGASFAVGLAVALSVSAGSVTVGAETPEVRHSAGATAPTIGLIGDSTLSGVRWFEAYDPLERFNFILDAESCRRTIETSCWSREQYRPSNAMAALQEHAGEWGQVLVLMTGYNDSSSGFGDAVEAMVAEAQRQGIGSVVWLSLRTKGVDYEEPLHKANGSTYRDANRTLYDEAAESSGYLQVADWATYSADRPEWFESDGVHLSPEGALAASDFVAAQVASVLAGESITPNPAPWEVVREGDEGDEVALVQSALLARGIDSVGVADGVFGAQTTAAVAELQRSLGVADTGEVDAVTAAALGLAPEPRPVSPPPPATAAPPAAAAATAAGATAGENAAAVPVPGAAPAAGALTTPAPESGGIGTTTLLLLLATTAAGGWWFIRSSERLPRRARAHGRQRRAPRPTPAPRPARLRSAPAASRSSSRAPAPTSSSRASSSRASAAAPSSRPAPPRRSPAGASQRRTDRRTRPRAT